MNTSKLFGAALIAAAAQLTALPALAKPLYLTVPRAYGSDESPIVEVAFAGKEPVELRVLQPSNLETFLTEQANLRRAYDPPLLQLNPGRFLSRGLNALRRPDRFMLFTLDGELRKDLSPSFPARPERDLSDQPLLRMAEGTPKLIGLPPGMKLVRSEWLNLDLGGKQRDYSVPGFDEWGGDGKYEERRLSLAPLPVGIYVLQLVQGRIEGQVLLVISDLSAQVKQTDGELLVRVAGRDQKPRPGAQVSLHVDGKAGATGKTDEKGELTLKADDPKLIVTAQVGNDVAVVDTDFYSSLAIAPDVFIYGDRPIYRPGDTAKFRGVVRRPDSFLVRLFRPKRREVHVKLISQGGREVSTEVAIDDFGCFAGQLAIPEGLDTGVLRLMAQLDDQSHQAEARVQQYVKPTFYLELVSDQDSVKPGEKIKAKVRARKYAGGAPAAGYEVFLYRTVLDTPSWVDDSGMGGQGSAVTYGSASTTEGMLSVPKRLFSSVAARLEARQADPNNSAPADEDTWASAPKFDKNGEAEVEVEVPALEPGEERFPFKYTLTVRARDDQGSFANGSRTYFFADSQVMGTLVPSAKVVLADAQASLSVRATTLAGRPFGEADGTLALILRKADGGESMLESRAIHTAADSVWRGALPTGKIGMLITRVTLKDKDGHPWVGEGSLLIAGKNGEAVARVPALSLDAIGGVLEPGDSAQLVAMFPESWGPVRRDEGPVWLTLSGATVFETKLINLSGRTLVHSFPIERRFGSAVYASVAYPTATGRWEERTVPFRIVPSERTLKVRAEPERAEAAPLGKQTLRFTVTDHAGHGVVAQLSVGVVDKAIYALQSEFRPPILDFFYPIGRNNVMSFYSAEFQGYGYGDQIARASRGLRPYEFAAIKPPSRRPKDQDRDTAYWNPAVVTDRDGRATVSFDLPSNQTLWTITTVAADASGRFGESTSEFATRGALNLVAALPQFLRAGDEATGSVRLSRGAEAAKGDAPLTVAINVAGGLSSDQRGEVGLTIPKAAEKVIAIPLKTAAIGGKGTIAVQVSGGPSPMSLSREIPIKDATIEETVLASAWGGGDLTLPVGKDSTVRALSLTLQPSVVDAALTATRDLLEYPYGCLEQLVATTIPNVAVLRTLEKVGALTQLDPESRSLLVEARSRAVQGVQQILTLAVKGGGFTLWSGQTTPSPELTLIALDGLAFAVEANLADKNDPRIVESESWLAKADDLPFELDATRAYVLARLDGAKAAPRVRALIDKAPAGNMYALAMAVLAAEHAGIRNEAALKDKVAALAKQSADSLAQVASYEPGSGPFWRYPLRRDGLSAILAHAASFSELDVAPVRRRLIETLSRASELSTFEKSTTLLHSLWLIERDAKALKALPPPSLEVPGTNEKPTLTPRGTGLSASLSPSVRQIRLGAFEGVATLSARVVTPLAAIKATQEGMTISRSYFVLRESGKKPLGPNDTVSQGEDVYVELSFDSHGEERSHSMRSAYTVLEDPVPAGFVPLIEDKAYRGAPYDLALSAESLKRRALSPEHASFFFDEPAWWSDHPHLIGYVMRAQFSGRFSAPPAQVEDMYATKVRARTAATTLTVVPSKAE